MKKYVLFLCCCITFLAGAQNELSLKYSLMPWPKEINENSEKFLIHEDLTLSINAEDTGRVYGKAVTFLRRLADRSGVFIKEGLPVLGKKGSIQISFDTVSNLTVNEDESYFLYIDEKGVQIKAITDVGAMHGLETLLQLVQKNELNYFFPGVVIKDAPRFVWRGLMIDVARHFQPLAVIKRNLDAMASVKLNVFHWHLTDDQGFRVASKVYPKLQKLASDGQFYTHEQLKEVVAYAANLGIRVVPEFDVPGHASALLAAYPELGSKEGYNHSIERFAGVFNPTLNPIKDGTYEFLNTLFTEITPLFPDVYFHIGGDENEGKHWDESKEIQAFKIANNLKSNHDLQTYFNIRLEKILNNLGKKLMGWDEIMTPNMPTTAVIHSWRGPQEGMLEGGTLIAAAKAGYQTVLSNGYYIDRMLPVAHHYATDPIGNSKLTKEERALILGGEATMWSELVTPQTIDSRIWPRTAAIAERFWSPKEVNDVENMKLRLRAVSARLEALGITHIKNRDLLLRNMSDYKEISSLKVLSNICEPLKVYSRNKGGTEYSSFSPLTLFADACVVDAEDAVGFKKAVVFLSKDRTKSNLGAVLAYLEIWSENDRNFNKISNTPKLALLKPLSKNLSELASFLITAFKKKSISSKEYAKALINIEIISKPFMDTEVAIAVPLNNLIMYCQEHFLSE
ncbi:family 20 glycosylhydrolase [uncultured Polaribacter sp.]|uniref:beta-N-acetylhexosaminidase n=1 Tax=uncultured Polaribacter sp. TaxID=174711 RepID=UPI000EBCC69C|nr:beta-N-acetylhexosaminidase [Polaribacter sp.]